MFVSFEYFKIVFISTVMLPKSITRIRLFRPGSLCPVRIVDFQIGRFDKNRGLLTESGIYCHGELIAVKVIYEFLLPECKYGNVL